MQLFLITSKLPKYLKTDTLTLVVKHMQKEMHMLELAEHFLLSMDLPLHTVVQYQIIKGIQMFYNI